MNSSTSLRSYMIRSSMNVIFVLCGREKFAAKDGEDDFPRCKNSPKMSSDSFRSMQVRTSKYIHRIVTH